MPRLWNETVEAHRREVREAILGTTSRLVREHGLLGVTMSRIAEETGIGRATLYRYFPDVEAILLAWHERHVDTHLERLATIRDGEGSSGKRLADVLEAYALICHESRGHEDTEIAALMHRGERVTRAERQLHEMVRGLVAEAQEAGEARPDVPAGDLATYCVHAVTAAHALRGEDAVRRLVEVVLAGLRPAR